MKWHSRTLSLTWPSRMIGKAHIISKNLLQLRTCFTTFLTNSLVRKHIPWILNFFIFCILIDIQILVISFVWSHVWLYMQVILNKIGKYWCNWYNHDLYIGFLSLLGPIPSHILSLFLSLILHTLAVWSCFRTFTKYTTVYFSLVSDNQIQWLFSFNLKSLNICDFNCGK